MPLTRLSLDGRWFRDAHGRHVWLRGVNLGGDCKVPFAPDGHSYRPTDFSDHRDVSFVGRPAPLDEIDGHLARLAHWGFNCLRLLTTWEAIEHAGPGDYDAEYLDYYAEVCRRAGEHGLYVFVDFHQDVWSRMSGGDGAPGWTFEVAGLDFTRFHAAGSAHVMAYNYDASIGGRQASYPQMSWGSNYRHPANGIMWTLFFAGADFAPGLSVAALNIQHYLQDHYLGAMRAVAERVAHLDNVIGFDTLNEPGTGWIGSSLDARGLTLSGPAFSPLDGLAVASGFSRTLDVAELGKGVVGSKVVNPGGVSIWRDNAIDPFRAAGAWDIGDDGEPVALRPDYFQQVGDRTVDVERDYMLPFFNRVAATIRELRPDWLTFAELDPFAAMRGGHGFPQGMPENTVNASHWYDFGALVTKRFDEHDHKDILTGEALVGRDRIEQSYETGLSRLRAAGDALNGGAPTLVGECGIAYDMNDAAAYAAWAAGDRSDEPWQPQITALELMYNVLDRQQLHSTQWNYTVSNRNDAMIGDGWNQEDLSIWSADQATDSTDPNSGGRAIKGFCRPRAVAVQGSVGEQRFDMASGIFSFSFEADPAIGAPTEVYLPDIQYPHGYQITLDGATWEKSSAQTVAVTATHRGIVTMTVERTS
jgi:Glycoside hydrolase family 5 C-terminal domain/Cellulase (glycosyl hydrolase family 5)